MSEKENKRYADVSRPPFGRAGLELRRWRNSRGFGVHSPAGFMLMRDVIRPQSIYGLYAYQDLDRMLERIEQNRICSYADRGVLRMLLRLSARLTPKHMIVAAPSPSLLHKLPQLAGVEKLQDDSDLMPDTLWIIGDRAVPGTLAANPGKATAIVLAGLSVAFADSLFDRLDGGVRIYADSLVLLLPRQDSAKHTYYARIKP